MKYQFCCILAKCIPWIYSLRNTRKPAKIGTLYKITSQCLSKYQGHEILKNHPRLKETDIRQSNAHVILNVSSWSEKDLHRKTVKFLIRSYIINIVVSVLIFQFFIILWLYKILIHQNIRWRVCSNVFISV